MKSGPYHQVNAVNYGRAKEVRRICELLSRGVWGDCAVAPKQYLEHDIALDDVHGKWGRDYYKVKQDGLKFQPPKQWSLGGLTLSRTRAPIKASILLPEKITLQNKEKNPKEIFMVFHEKYFEQDATEDTANRKRLNFNNASLMAKNRHHDFTAFSGGNKEKSIQQLYLMQIRESLIRLHRNKKLEPKPPKIRLTLGGEGLAGLDAQLMLAAMAEDLLKEDGVLSKFEGLKDIELEIDLVTYDSVKTSSVLAKQTSENIKRLRDTFPKIKFSGLDVQHGKSQEGLGSRHILADAPDNIAKVNQQVRDREGDLIDTNSNSPDGQQKLIKRMSNNRFMSAWHSSMPGRLVHDALALFRNIGRKLFKLDPIKTAFIKDAVSEDVATSGAVKSQSDKLYNSTNKLLDQTDLNERLKIDKRPPIENLVFEGGGVKGTVYAGALKQMAHHDLYKDVKRVAGSSAGGIVSTLLAMGFRPEQIEAQMNSLDFKAMMDSSGQEKAFTKLGAKVMELYSLYKNKGIYKGEKFLEVIGNMMTEGLEQQLKEYFKNEYAKQNGGDFDGYEEYAHEKILALMREMDIIDFNSITFGQHHALKEKFPELGLKDLYLTATLMESGTLQVFSYESSPNLQIRHAARATMSFPGAFMPFEIEGKVYADGGIANNYPMNIFDESKYLPEGFAFNASGANPGSLGFLVDTEAEIKERWGIKDPAIFKKLSASSFFSQLIGGLHNRADELHRRYHTNSIQIFDEEVPTMDLEITDETRQKLVDSGARAFDAYAETYRHIDNLWHYKSVPGANEELKASKYGSLDEKYSKLSIKGIEKNIAEIDRYIESISALRGEYFIEFNRINALKQSYNERYQALKQLEQQRRDKQDVAVYARHCIELKKEIDALDDALDIIDAAIGDEGVLQSRLNTLAAEKAVAEAALRNHGVSPASVAPIVSPLRFSTTAPAPAVTSATLLKSKTRIEIPNASEGAFKASKKIVKEADKRADNNYSFTKNKCTFDIPVKDVDKSLKATIEKHPDGKMGYFIDKVPESDEGMKMAFRQLYEVMFQGIINSSEQNQEITLNFVGEGAELAALKSVLLELQEKYKADLDNKGITIKTKEPSARQGMQRGSAST